MQDLLIRVPPDNTASAIDDLEETRAFLRVTGVSEAKGLTEVHEGIYHQLMVAPLQLWKNLAEDDVAIADRVHLSFLLSRQDAGALIPLCRAFVKSIGRLSNVYPISAILKQQYQPITMSVLQRLATLSLRSSKSLWRITLTMPFSRK